MKRYRIQYILLVTLVAISLSGVLSCSKQANELEGTWVLTYDPDSPDAPSDDMVVFKSGNQVDLRDSQSVYLSCTYEKDQENVVIACDVNGKIKTLIMEFSPDDRNILINPTGAQYTKQ